MALTQVCAKQNRVALHDDFEADFRILPRQSGHDRHHEPGGQRLGASDLQLADVWVGEELEFFDAVAQVIKGRNAPLDHGTPVARRLDPLRAAVEQPEPERMLKLGHRLRVS
jgi:hypothetical protein